MISEWLSRWENSWRTSFMWLATAWDNKTHPHKFPWNTKKN